MLGLVAAQLKMKVDEFKPKVKPVWIDVSEREASRTSIASTKTA